MGDSWQYLFCLKPRPEHNNKSLKLVTAIGKLDMVSPEQRGEGISSKIQRTHSLHTSGQVWRTQLCDRGRLQTSQLQRMPPSPGEVKLYFPHSLWLTFQVRLSFLTAPSFALLDHPLPLVLRLENNCERTVRVPVLKASSVYSAGELSNHQFYAGWAWPFPLFTHLWPANLVSTKLSLNRVQTCC